MKYTYHATKSHLCRKFRKFIKSNIQSIFISHWSRRIIRGCLRWIRHHWSIIWTIIWIRRRSDEIWRKSIIWYILENLLVGRFILKSIVVGIWVVERVISRILGVKRVIVGIHFTKKIFRVTNNSLLEAK